MGQFSWLDSVTEKQIVDGRIRDVYLLVPKEMGGGHIREECYDGYGIFGGKDVYDLVADWNKNMIPEILLRIGRGKWKCSTTPNDRRVMLNFFEGKPLDEGLERLEGYSGLGVEKRIIGIIMACYDEDNERLDYPIKITYNPHVEYEKCAPSKSDPNQGWEE